MTGRVTLTVLLRPAHGGELPAEGVTSENVTEHAPDPSAARRVQDWFAAQGFEVAPTVGSAFTVTAPAEPVRAAFGEIPASGELDIARLPADVAEHVRAVVAEPPLDFGPTSW